MQARAIQCPRRVIRRWKRFTATSCGPGREEVIKAIAVGDGMRDVNAQQAATGQLEQPKFCQLLRRQARIEWYQEGSKSLRAILDGKDCLLIAEYFGKIRIIRTFGNVILVLVADEMGVNRVERLSNGTQSRLQPNKV